MLNISRIFLLAFPVLFFISCNPQKFDEKDIATVKELTDSHKDFIVGFYPDAVEANKKIKIDRALLIDLRNDYRHVIVKGHKLDELNEIASSYRIGDSIFSQSISRVEYQKLIDTLLFRVDYIPEKLVMAQTIIESGWGKSKFSREINNYYGIRCYTPGCGVRPSGVESPKFWVKSYPSKEACIEEYMWLLNTGFAYEHFRERRLELRQSGDYPNAIMVAQGLKRYSEKGSEYITLIESIINNYLPENLDEFVKYAEAEDKGVDD